MRPTVAKYLCEAIVHNGGVAWVIPDPDIENTESVLWRVGSTTEPKAILKVLTLYSIEEFDGGLTLIDADDIVDLSETINILVNSEGWVYV